MEIRLLAREHQSEAQEGNPTIPIRATRALESPPEGLVSSLDRRLTWTSAMKRLRGCYGAESHPRCCAVQPGSPIRPRPSSSPGTPLCGFAAIFSAPAPLTSSGRIRWKGNAGGLLSATQNSWLVLET